MTPARTRRLRAGALGLALVLAGACTRLATPRRTAPGTDHAAIVTALVARERALPGLRLSMRVRSLDAGGAGLLTAPAFLAVDRGGRLRLQVLSPFGVTLLELEIAGARYRLRLPLRGESRRGRIDVTALAGTQAPPAERMIVALALLFRPRIRAAACVPAGPGAVRCAFGDGLATTVHVDARLRPTREAIGRADGPPFLVAEYEAATGAARDAPPARVTIRDLAGAGRLEVRVVRAHAATPRNPH